MSAPDATIPPHVMTGRIHPDVCLVVGERLFVGVSQKLRSSCQRTIVPKEMLVVVLTFSANLARVIITVAYPQSAYLQILSAATTLSVKTCSVQKGFVAATPAFSAE